MLLPADVTYILLCRLGIANHHKPSGQRLKIF